MNILKMLGVNRRDKAAEDLYLKIVEQARQPVFYTDFGVPDTVDGRFDMIVLLAYVVFRRLREEGAAAAKLSQNLFDHMFADMDQNLREIGVGDLSVGRKIKELVTLFYGRVAAYDAALEAGRAETKAALVRNLFRKTEIREDQTDAMAAYLETQVAAAEGWHLTELAGGHVSFLRPETAS